MGRPWKQFQDELDRRGRGLQWLADRMGCSVQRVQNWVSRGVPRGAFPELAEALDESIDWVAGRAPPKPRPKELDEDSKQFAAEYQMLSMDDRKLLRTLYDAVRNKPAMIEPPAERPYLGGVSGFGDFDEDEEHKRGSK